ncbi:MAG: twin transmembrane helix small protein [Gammaproteobacteria bacterium]|nr:twin transmembrane helix small protein [Gammaproteobacteria bacterium]
MLIKIFIVLMLLLVFVSLFSALVLLFRNKGQGTGMVKALTWRIGLSLTLFILLIAGLYFGIIPPGGLSPAPGR